MKHGLETFYNMVFITSDSTWVSVFRLFVKLSTSNERILYDNIQWIHLFHVRDNFQYGSRLNMFLTTTIIIDFLMGVLSPHAYRITYCVVVFNGNCYCIIIIITCI